MSSTGKEQCATIVYPLFDGEGGIQIDLYEDETSEEALGSADFPLMHLADEFINEFGDEEGHITDIEAVEYAYVMIDALRDAANKLAGSVDSEEA